MASRGKHIQLNHMYVADFETCDSHDPIGDEVPDQRVWLAGWKNLDSKEKQYYNSIDGFMTSILSRGTNQNTEYAFHNLRFDGSFIVPWLLNNNFNFTHEKPKAGEFTMLLAQPNSWYSITIQVTKRRRVHIWDSAKLFPDSLENLPTIYGTLTQKVIEDQSFYTLKRPEGHKATEQEMAYFNPDLDVLEEVINAHISFHGLLFKKTQASQAFKAFEDHFPWWKKRFPPLEDDLDKDMRKGYWGGISYVNKDIQGKDQKDINVYDINSSYPAQLAYKKMPYGPCQYTCHGKPPNMALFWVASAYVTFTIKENKVPCIMSKGVLEGLPIIHDHWLSDSEGIVKLVFSSIDFKTFQDSYNFEVISWDWSHHFAWKVQREIKEYILKNNEEKVHYKKLAKKETTLSLINEYLARSQRAKINNNSFYGKFGEMIIKMSKTPHIDEDDNIQYLADHEEVQKMAKRKYLPLAIATTAYGRQQLVMTANTLSNDFFYCDTDSIHFNAKAEYKLKQASEQGLFKIDSTLLGAWDFEGHYDRGRYLRSKCYYEQVIGETADVTLAGLPADKQTGSRSKIRSCITWENFHIGLVIPGGNGKLRTIRTKSGVKLVQADFTITEKTKFMY